MNKEFVAIGIVTVIACGFAIWTAAGRPPIGPFNNLGFDSTWDCPPNAKSSAVVCIKKPRPPKQ
jgi:hypothetical protein